MYFLQFCIWKIPSKSRWKMEENVFFWNFGQKMAFLEVSPFFPNEESNIPTDKQFLLNEQKFPQNIV